MFGVKSKQAIQQTMGFTQRCDPIPKAEKRALNAELKGTDRILNNGENLYMRGGNTLIFDPTKTPEQIEAEEIAENPYGQTAQFNHAGCFAYNDGDDWSSELEEDLSNWNYVVLDEEGNGYWDTGTSCYFGKDTGASFEFEGEELTTEAPQLTPEQEAFLSANTEPQGELTTAFSAAADPEEESPSPAPIAANNPSYQAPALRA